MKTIKDSLRDWMGHMCDCDNHSMATEQCRLTHSQAMKLVYEISKDPYQNPARALAAYNAGRPFDLLSEGYSIRAPLVPYRRIA